MRIGVRAFALAIVEVRWTFELDTSLVPLVRQTVGVIHVHVDRPGHRRRGVLSLGQMDREFVTMRKCIVGVVMGSREPSRP
jgi:hypothetical protein